MKILTQYLVLIFWSIWLVFVSGSSGTERTRNKINSAEESLVYIPPSSESGTPQGKRNGTISRNPVVVKCETEAQNCLVALVPKYNWGYTIASRPTFWFYASGSITKALTFRLVDVKDETIIYQTTIKLEQREGIINIRLPPEIPELKIGREYRWSFAYSPQINSLFRPEINVFGRSKRIISSANLIKDLNLAKTERERVLIYAKNGLWQDALTLLARLYQTEPQSEVFQKDWSELLDSVGLESLVSVPIIAN